jgi:hypothetical protein
MDDAQARRWIASFYDVSALTDDLVLEAARLLSDCQRAQYLVSKARVREITQPMKQQARCDARWDDFKRRHGLVHKKPCENCGLMFTPSRADDKTCSPACQAARYPKRIREPVG